MREAAKTMANAYQTDKELTVFSSLEGEIFENVE